MGTPTKTPTLKAPASLLALLTLAALTLTPACSAETPPPTNTTQALAHGLPLGGATVGHQIGNIVPEFTLALADGSTITSTQLVNDSRPTFLFFFAST